MLLALGIGAGLRAGELAAASVTTSWRAKTAWPSAWAVPGRDRARHGAYAKAVARQAKQVGLGYLFCPGGADRAYKNFVNNFSYGLVADPAAPSFLRGGPGPVSYVTTWRPARLWANCFIWPASPRSSRCCVMPATSGGAPSSKAELRERLRGPMSRAPRPGCQLGLCHRGYFFLHRGN